MFHKELGDDGEGNVCPLEQLEKLLLLSSGEVEELRQNEARMDGGVVF